MHLLLHNGKHILANWQCEQKDKKTMRVMVLGSLLLLFVFVFSSIRLHKQRVNEGS